MILADAVVDSSVLVRAAVDATPDSRRWIDAVESEEVEALAPELIYAELASALRAYVAAGLMSAGSSDAVLRTLLGVPLQTRRLSLLAPSALRVAVGRGISAYDAFYVVLAEAADVVLVTADRRLAAATDRSVLIE